VSETAWVIEKYGLCLGNCIRGHKWVTFTDDKAQRFPSEISARVFAESIGLKDYTVTEHMWCAPSPEEAKPTNWVRGVAEDCDRTIDSLPAWKKDSPVRTERDELVEAARAVLGSVADLEGTPIDYRVGKALAESCNRLRRALAAQGGK
jgi:hypothetical protein